MFDGRERVLRRGDEAVPLTPKAFDLLAAFVEEPGRLLSKDELLKQVWPDTFVEESNLAYHVFVLRKALGESSGDGQYIETVPKRGYRFTAAVTPANSGGVGSSSDPVPVSEQPPSTAQMQPSGADPARRAPSLLLSARSALVGLAVLPAIVLLVAAWMWRGTRIPNQRGRYH